MLGGSGDTLDNLFCATQNPTNSPEMRDDEQRVYDAVFGKPATNDPGQTVQYSVYLDYPDARADSVPKYIQLEAHGQNGLQLGTSLVNPDSAAQQIRRRQGIQ